MKTDVHPPYYPDAQVTCNGCGRTYTVGSTIKQATVELCSNCHPFYTGKQKLVDTAGRVERYQARAAKRGGKATAKSSMTAPAQAASQSADAPAEPDTPEGRLAKMKSELTDTDGSSDDSKQ